MMKFKTINGWTKEKMKEHIIQNFRGQSTASDGLVCLYRGPNGAKCAVGLFIPESVASTFSYVENTFPIHDLLDAYPAIRGHMPLGLTALRVFQSAHDNSNPENTLKNLLNFVDNRVIDEEVK